MIINPCNNKKCGILYRHTSDFHPQIYMNYLKIVQLISQQKMPLI